VSNQAIPFGFLDNGLMDGSMPTFGFYPGTLSSTNANSIYGGDVAKTVSGGNYDVFLAPVGGGETVGGIFLPNFTYLSKSQGMRSRNRAWLGTFSDIVAGANNNPTCSVVMSKDAVFMVRTAGLATPAGPVLQASVGLNANFAIGPAPGNNLISAFWLDDSTISNNPALPFTIYAIAQQPVSDPTSQYNIVYVKFNNLQQP
jgi:hypothetical protein